MDTQDRSREHELAARRADEHRAFALELVDFAIDGALDAGIEPEQLYMHVDDRLGVSVPVPSRDDPVADLITALEASLAAVQGRER